MGAKLANGPIIIGESHTSVLAREAIVYLIVNKKIKFLSLEGPVIPAPQTDSGGALLNNENTRNSYIGAASLMANENYSFSKLVTIAQKYNVKVYFHDLPSRYALAGLIQPRSPERNDYDAQITNVMGNVKIKRPVKPQSLETMLPQRNSFSARLLTNVFGQGVAQMPGLAILAGSHHTIATECGGQNLTIQAYLNIPDSSVFNFSDD